MKNSTSVIFTGSRKPRLLSHDWPEIFERPLFHVWVTYGERGLPKRCERREMPRSSHEKEKKRCPGSDNGRQGVLRISRLSHEAKSASPLHLSRYTWEPHGQTTHYADDALSDERKSRSLRTFVPPPSRLSHFYEEKTELPSTSCVSRILYILAVRWVICFSFENINSRKSYAFDKYRSTRYIVYPYRMV